MPRNAAAWGARLTRTAGGITTSYFGLYEKDSTGVERWYYSMGGSTIAQREQTATSDTTVWLTGDQVGSVSLVTGDAASHGSVISDTEYSPWGETRGGTGTKPTTLDYTGAHRDGTGLVYLGARYYDPTLGRFLSPDAVIDGVNPYSYVRNNPLTHADPSGHSDCSDECNNPNSPGGAGDCGCSGQYGGYTGIAGEGGGGGIEMLVAAVEEAMVLRYIRMRGIPCESIPWMSLKRSAVAACAASVAGTSTRTKSCSMAAP